MAQAQKEFTVNEALARLDGLLHAAVEGEANVPPAAPSTGKSWTVGSQPIGDRAEHTGEIALWQTGNWLFAAPIIGLSVFDKSFGCVARYDGVWQCCAAITEPTGGTTEDTEARTAITELVAAAPRGDPAT